MSILDEAVKEIIQLTIKHPGFNAIPGEMVSDRNNRVAKIMEESFNKVGIPLPSAALLPHLAVDLIKRNQEATRIVNAAPLVPLEEAADIVSRSLAAAKNTLSLVDEGERDSLKAELASGNVEKFARQTLCECHYDEKMEEIGQKAFDAVMAGLDVEEYKERLIKIELVGDKIHCYFNGLISAVINDEDINRVFDSCISRLKEKEPDLSLSIFDDINKVRNHAIKTKKINA